jgi:Tfp pilus assembly protein PilF
LEALIALAQREHRAGRLAEAAAACGRIIALRPDIAEVHNELGVVLAKQGRLDQALPRFERALALKPGYAEAHNNLGNILLRQGKLDAAAARYQLALALSPDYAEAHNNLGNVFWNQGRLEGAAARFERAIALCPNFAEAHSNLGNVLLRQGKLDLAEARFRQAVALKPGYAEAYNSLGNALWQQGRIDEATTQYQQAALFGPDLAEAHNNLGNVFKAQGKPDEAAARYQQALTLRPDLIEAHLGLATCYLAAGDYERGWPEYEWRLRISGHEPRHRGIRWTGQPLAGRSLLLVAEQGLGDTLLFVRYARLLKQQGARVVLACQAALGRLLASNRDLDELFYLGSAEPLPATDFYLPLLSAPGAFGTKVSSVPCEVPYLAADPDLTDRWRAALTGAGRLKVGIVWQGSRGFGLDHERSIPLAQFAPLARVPGVRLISLQKGFGQEQIAGVDFPVIDLAQRIDEESGAFMDTVAVIRNLDLVVAADTAIAHLAGGLGAPVWVALPFSPYWIWLRDRDDSPWYPTARLFRQTLPGRWTDVFERMATAVETSRQQTR